MDIMTLSLGHRIRFLREIKGISQKDFAAKCNVSPAAASKWELNLSNPTKNNLLQIARVLGMTYEELTGKRE